MKKILIATDFSTAARNATDYALQLAAPFKAAVTLMKAAAAAAAGADLIVAGIIGNERTTRKIFGSTATGLP